MTARRLSLFFLTVIAVSAVLCFGPWYEEKIVTKIIALIKWAFLVYAFVNGLLVVKRLRKADPQRRPFFLLTVGLMCYALGQTVLATYQVALGIKLPFPSFGDPFFVISSVLLIWAFLDFCVLSARSGLPMGSGLVFWSPAMGVVAVLIVAAYPLLAPIIAAGDPPVETLLNLYYPLSSFLTLGPCLVMLRVGLKFRGGRLLWVWLPLTIGVLAVLCSDILFSYLTSLDLVWTETLMDFLYMAGYGCIAWGISCQLFLIL